MRGRDPCALSPLTVARFVRLADSHAETDREAKHHFEDATSLTPWCLCPLFGICLCRLRQFTFLSGSGSAQYHPVRQFACGQSTALNPPGWNERHTGVPGGALVEQHEGGTSVETVGTWTTSLVGGRGRVTYSYTGGTSPVYEVAAVANGNCNPSCATLPQTYEFCGVGGGAPATLTIRITTASISPPLSSCPTNP